MSIKLILLTERVIAHYNKYLKKEITSKGILQIPQKHSRRWWKKTLIGKQQSQFYQINLTWVNEYQDSNAAIETEKEKRLSVVMSSIFT